MLIPIKVKKKHKKDITTNLLLKFATSICTGNVIRIKVTKNAVREMPRKINIVTNVIHYKNKVSTLQNKFEGYVE